MKVKRLKKIAAFMTCCLMVLSAIPVMAASVAVESDDWEKADESYFKQDMGLAGNPSLKIKKVDPDKNQPIKGIVFKAVKVGDLYQIKHENSYEMVFGLNADFAEKAGMGTADYTLADNGTRVSCYKDASAINTAVQESNNKTNIKTYLNGVSEHKYTTGNDGIAAVSDASYGLYVVMEWDVSEAKLVDGDKESDIAITKQENPYVVSVPTYIDGENGNPGNWTEDVVVKTKNNTDDATVEKKIVTNYNGENNLKTGNDAELDDTDITSISDTVEFYLKSSLPIIPKTSDETITKYVLTDRISKGLTVDFEQGTNFTVETSDAEVALIQETDYRISVEDINDNSDALYSGGKTIEITFTKDGWKKLTELSKKHAGKAGGAENTEAPEKQYVYVYYKAVVNANAVIGPTGNPNEVQLGYQVGQSPAIETGWDKVIEYTFAIEGTKQLSKDTLTQENAAAVKFVLYQEENKNKTYYIFNPVLGSSGEYTVSSTTNNLEEATEVSPQKVSNGTDQTTDTFSFVLKGLEEGTYYLQETQTVSGYNLLKAPIEITLTAAKGENTYTGTQNQYLGTLTENKDDDGTASLTVINTKGFELPGTGGKGMWLFVLAGMAVVAAGVIYFITSGKKDKKRL